MAHYGKFDLGISDSFRGAAAQQTPLFEDDVIRLDKRGSLRVFGKSIKPGDVLEIDVATRDTTRQHWQTGDIAGQLSEPFETGLSYSYDEKSGMTPIERSLYLSGQVVKDPFTSELLLQAGGVR